MTVTILGVQIDRVTFATALDQIEGFVGQKTPHQIVTVNPEFVMRAQDDVSFRHVLNNADLAVPDGAGLLWASRILAKRHHLHTRTASVAPILTERVTGTDLLPALAERAVAEGWKIYLLGGLPGMAKRAAERLEKQWPHLRVVGAECGPQISQEGKPLNRDQAALLEAVIGRIREAKPQILFVGFGAPKQDRFIARYKKELHVPVMIGVGGAFEFIAGHAKRAPRIMQFLWLEWLWRVIREPSRIGRIWTAVGRFSLAVWFSR